MADVAFSIPKSYSVTFDGDGDYLFTTPIPFNASGIFTIEFWFKTNSSNLQGLFFSGNPGSNNQRIQLEILANGALGLYMQTTATPNQSVVSAAGLINTNTWYHVAFVRRSDAYLIYLNGNSVASAIISITSNPINLYIGLSRSSSILRYLNGYISNFRVVNGLEVYTGNFTPPTQPLYPIQNTTFLTCQSPTIIDKSYNPLPITAFGNTRVDDENPFGFTTSTSVSAKLFDDILTTDSVINLITPTAKSVFDIYDINSGIDAPVNVIGTDEILNQVIPAAKSVFDIYNIQSSIDIPQDVVITDTLIIPKTLSSQNRLQYNINSRNNFSNIEPITSSDEAVNVSRFLKTQIIERTSPQKINSLRILVENTQTVVNYSYWI